MSSSANEMTRPRAIEVNVTDDALVVRLSDGRSVSVPLSWYPRLEHATRTERATWELLGEGIGVHWPLIDEDISIHALLAGRRSNESNASFGRWLGLRGNQ